MMEMPTTSAGSRAVSGRLEGIDREGRPLFREQGVAPAYPVRIAMDADDEALAHAAAAGSGAVVVHEENGSPILIGLIRDRISPARDAGVKEAHATVDGRYVRIRADHEIELRCGKSRLLLRSDGRIVLQGAHVVSSSTGPHRIKGATIALN